ncbi:Hypothetical protein SMAX5B_022132 [Scophthalmus maximus]|uniref:Uncharacterized protein n=1 Tax=Scophthalmus maximus TaxID=52904 RepID=A0A2U9CYG5_SCOMX|nr:Hypothetical protein SMAX5B_022132 [Scophthalmus maximus]
MESLERETESKKNQNAAAWLVVNLPMFSHSTLLLRTGFRLQALMLTVLRMAQALPTSKWANLTPQPVHSALLLPNGFLLPHCEGTVGEYQCLEIGFKAPPASEGAEERNMKLQGSDTDHLQVTL